MTGPLKALIVDGRVHELAAFPDGTFHPDLDVRALPDVGEQPTIVDVAVGWTVDAAGTYAAPVVVPPTRDELIAFANHVQWVLATGGYTATIGGKPIRFATDEGSLAALDRKAMRLAQPNPPASVSWQVSAIEFITIGADEFAHAATKVDDFVQATFDALPAIFAAIGAGTITTFADVGAAVWPAPNGAVS